MSLEKITKYLKQENLSAILLNTKCEFLAEFANPLQNILLQACGFTGSNGICLIRASGKHLFLTDSRYLTQAKGEISKDFQIFDLAEISIAMLISEHFTANDKIIFPAKNFLAAQILNIKKLNNNIEFLADNSNPLAKILPVKKIKTEKIWLHNENMAINNIAKKHKLLNLAAAQNGYFCSDAASISWFLNIRGKDCDVSPLVNSYLLSNSEKILLFVEIKKIPKNCAKYLQENNVEILELNEIANLGLIAKKLKITKLNCDLTNISYFFYQKFAQTAIALENSLDKITKLKAVKNKYEIAGMIDAHILDGQAVTNFLYWLDKHPNPEKLDELKIAAKIADFRKKNKEYLGNSFATIAGFAENSAIIHYQPNKKTNKQLQENNLLLLDSGGQYKNGTTDITRTIAIGKPSKKQIKCYNLVLQGHIALAQAIFPKGSSGAQLDVLARQYLWQNALNYGHGTGHGVGCYLNVHEGPQGISANNHAPLEAGMILSNEPGVYLVDNFGIRIENLILVKEYNADFLQFETISLALLDKNLIDLNMLSNKEKKWLKNYHLKIAKTL